MLQIGERLFLVLYILFSSPFAQAQITLYVSPNGNDKWSGRLLTPNVAFTDGPLASLSVAKNRVRDLMQAPPLGGIVVQVRGGRYELQDPLSFTEADKATESAPVVYRGYQNEHPILSVGKIVQNCAPLRGKVLRCDVSKLGLQHVPPLIIPGLTHSSVPQFQLYWGETRLDLARWPNRDPSDMRGMGAWAHIQSVEGEHGIVYPASMRAENWRHVERAIVHVFPEYDWRDYYLAVRGIDLLTRVLQFPPELAIDKLQAGRRFYVSNVFEELDAPGEWYFSDKTNELFVYPPKDAQGNLVASFAQNVVQVDGASHLAFEGFVLEHANGSAVVIKGDSNRLAGSIVRHAGAFGIEVFGADNLIISNEIYDLALGGVKVSGGDRNTLSAARNIVHNNDIHDYGRVLEMNYSPGIELNGVGQTVSNNLIHNAPHHAIWIKGNDHIVEFNEIHHVDQDCDDCGAVASYGDWTYRGVVVRYNLIHDIVGYGFRKHSGGKSIYGSPFFFGAAIYVDGAVSGWTIQGNVIYRVPGPQIFVNGGRDHLIENNLLVESGFGNAYPPLVIRTIPNESFFRTRNIKNLTVVPYQSKIWRTRYPDLSGILNSHYTWPEGNVIRDNISCALRAESNGFIAYKFQVPLESVIIEHNYAANGGYPLYGTIGDPDWKKMQTLTWEQWRQQVDHHAQVASIEFVDSASDDYRFAKNSFPPEGFAQIPFEKMGTKPDKYQSIWPHTNNFVPVDVRAVENSFDE